jgi:hypothetical protein
VNRNTNWFKRILWEFQLGKGKTSGLIRETYSRLERVWKWHPGWGRENSETFIYGVSSLQQPPAIPGSLLCPCLFICPTPTLSSPPAQPPAVPGSLLCPCPFVLSSMSLSFYVSNSNSILSSSSSTCHTVACSLLCPCPFVLSSMSCTFTCPTQLYPAFVLFCAIVLWQKDGHFLKTNCNHNTSVTYETGRIELLTWGRLNGWRSWAQWPRIFQVCAFPFPFPVPATWRPVPDFSENTQDIFYLERLTKVHSN